VDLLDFSPRCTLATTITSPISLHSSTHI
jgi:hypothetical protein